MALEMGPEGLDMPGMVFRAGTSSAPEPKRNRSWNTWEYARAIW